MKQTLTIITLAAALLATIFAAASAGTAQADATGNETCGGSVSNNAWYYDGSVNSFELNTHWNCGDSKTFTYEAQHTTDGGNHWSDWCCDNTYHSPAGCNGGCNKWLEVVGQDCVLTGSYRIHYWWADGNWASSSRGAGVVC